MTAISSDFDESAGRMSFERSLANRRAARANKRPRKRGRRMREEKSRGKGTGRKKQRGGKEKAERKLRINNAGREGEMENGQKEGPF